MGFQHRLSFLSLQPFVVKSLQMIHKAARINLSLPKLGIVHLSFVISLLIRKTEPSVKSMILQFLNFWAAAPKESMTYAVTHMGDFFLLLFLLLLLLRSVLPSDSDHSLKAQIPALRPKFQP